VTSEMPKPLVPVAASNGSGEFSMRAAIDTPVYGTRKLISQSHRLALYRIGPTLLVEGTRYA
jgi:hypothetical protein